MFAIIADVGDGISAGFDGRPGSRVDCRRPMSLLFAMFFIIPVGSDNISGWFDDRLGSWVDCSRSGSQPFKLVNVRISLFIY